MIFHGPYSLQMEPEFPQNEMQQHIGRQLISKARRVHPVSYL